MSNGFKWSKFQRAGFSAVVEGEHNLIIQAVAGSGKTTFLIEAIKRLCSAPGFNKSTALMAFNQKVIEEARQRIEAQRIRCNVVSFNAYGWSILRETYKGIEFVQRKADLEIESALNSVYHAMHPEFTAQDLEVAFSVMNRLPRLRVNKYNFKWHLTQLVNTVRSTGAFLDEYVVHDWEKFVEQQLPTLFEDNLDIDFTNPQLLLSIRPYVTALAALGASITKDLDDDIATADYADQVRQPVLKALIVKRNSPRVLLLDESQDFARYQLIMTRMMIATGTRIIAVGDRKQAIYAFRGADETSMDKIKDVANCVELPLSITYRVPSVIAQYVMETLQLSDNYLIPAKEGGEVRYVNTESGYLEALAKDPKLKKLQAEGTPRQLAIIRDKYLTKARAKVVAKHKPSMVISATNAPLLMLYLELKSSGVSCGINDKQLIDKMEKQATSFSRKYDDWEEFNTRLDNQLEQPLGRISKAKRDLLRSLQTVIDYFHVQDWDEMFRAISRIKCQDLYNDVELHTVHSVKGLEADVTFVLNTFFDSTQIANMAYVGLTRSKEKLITELKRGTVFHADKTLRVELIVEQNHGHNLRSILTVGEWEQCKALVVSRSKGRCEICGDLGDIECHELWRLRYTGLTEWLRSRGLLVENMTKAQKILAYGAALTGGQAPITGKQELYGLLGLCSPCHKAIHYGYALISGTENVARTQLKKVNGWDEQRLDTYLEKAVRRYEATNKMRFNVDVSWLLDNKQIKLCQKTIDFINDKEE